MLFTIFTSAANAILPIIMLIALGYVLRQSGFLTDSFLAMANRFVFNVALPVSLFNSVYKIEDLSTLPLNLVAYCAGAVLIIFFLALATLPLFTRDPKRKGVILQASFRSNNSIIGLTLSELLGGTAAVAVASVVIGFIVPLFNILAVIALSLFVNEGKKPSMKSVLLKIAKNPLILGILTAYLVLFIRTGEKALFGSAVFTIKSNLTFLYTFLSQLGSIATPMALIVLGGQFRFSAAGSMKKEIIIGTSWRVLIAPVLGLGGAYLISSHTGFMTCGPAEYPVMIALFASPAAVSSAIMAAQMGNDEQLATQLVVWSTIFSAVSMFVFICILMSMGLLAV